MGYRPFYSYHYAYLSVLSNCSVRNAEASDNVVSSGGLLSGLWWCICFLLLLCLFLLQCLLPVLLLLDNISSFSGTICTSSRVLHSNFFILFIIIIITAFHFSPVLILLYFLLLIILYVCHFDW